METKKTAGEKELQSAINVLYTFNEILYQRIFEDLSIQQINLLKALVLGKSEKLTSKAVIEMYNLGTSATVLRSLEALEKKEVIDRFSSNIEFIDPGFKMWLNDKIFNLIN